MIEPLDEARKESFMKTVQAMLSVEHPDRVVWYQSLIQEWTYQTPHVMADGETVVAWVGPYTSHAGLIHAYPTGVRQATVEQALEQLANDLYADLQADLAYLRQMGVSVASSQRQARRVG
jgi:hypothetical protein